MAKKEQKQLELLQMPLPDDIKQTRTVRADLTGLNMRQTTDTGELSMEKNISTLDTPYLIPRQKRTKVYQGSGTPVGLFGFEDFLLYVYEDIEGVKIDYIRGENVYTGVLQSINDENYIGAETQRQIVKFNVYKAADADNAAGSYIYKLLIFPDRKSMDFEISADFEVSDMVNINKPVKCFYNENAPYTPDGADSDTDGEPIEYDGEYLYLNTFNNLCFYRISDNGAWEDENGNPIGEWTGCVAYGFPSLKYVTVHLSRLFGVDDNNVYASGFNDYSNWDLDTAEDINDAHAWVSAAQSNTKANGAFTGIFTYQNHVVLFKDDFMHELTNTKNPFRINDIFAEGTFDARTIQDVDGKLIFVSRDGVKAYTGGNPKIIGYKLNIGRFTEAVSGTDNRRYFLYCVADGKNRLLVYDTYFDRWAEEETDDAVNSFANNKNGMYMLTESGDILKLDTGEYDGVEWAFETDFTINEVIDIKHIRRLQLLADIPPGSKMKIYLLYDGEEFSDSCHLVYDSEKRKNYVRRGNGNSSGNLTPIRIVPRKTANFGFKMHFEGEGYVRLRQIEIIMSEGGALYK